MNFEYYYKLQKSGDLVNAEKGYKKLLRKNIKSVDIFLCLGFIYMKTNRLKAAKKYFLNVLMIKENNFLALNNLGLICFYNKNFAAAKEYFLKASLIEKNSKTFYYLAMSYTELNVFSKAIKYYNNSIKIDNNPESFCNLGKIYYTLGDLEKSEALTKLSLKKNPNLHSAYNNLGIINLSYGRLLEAKKYFKKCININNSNCIAHYNLSNLINFKHNNSYKNDLIKLLHSCKTEEDKAYISFSLGKAFKDINNYDESYKYYSQGNFLKRKGLNYSFITDQKRFNNIIKSLSRKKIDKYSNMGFNDCSPIFILGMPRSGTSLIEQILSTHSQVIGAGEHNILDSKIEKYFIKNNKILIKNFTKRNFYNCGYEYIQETKKKYKYNKYLTNKLPLNFKWIGLIKIILPNAKIIHCKRNPADTCFSIFEQNFIPIGNEFTFDIEEIARYYNLYLNLIEHWKKIPNNNIYEIEYENLILNQKSETKKILKYCLLKWEPACMNFYKTKRIVRTASDNQVRKKIYKTSINKSSLYKKNLKKLFFILENKLI